MSKQTEKLDTEEKTISSPTSTNIPSPTQAEEVYIHRPTEETLEVFYPTPVTVSAAYSDSNVAYLSELLCESVDDGKEQLNLNPVMIESRKNSLFGNGRRRDN